MSDLHDAFNKLRDTPLGKIADNLGYLCLAWSWLELEVTATACALMEPLEIDASASIVNNMDMRDKIKGLLALGFIKKSSDDWYNELKTTIRSEEHTSELQSIMSSSYSVFCLTQQTY